MKGESFKRCMTKSRCLLASIIVSAVGLAGAISSLGQVQFTAARYSVWETGRTAVLTVTRGTIDGPAVSVHYATSDGTATAGQDYAATHGTPIFGPGEMEKSFTIPIVDDEFPEGPETLRVSLSGLTSSAVFGPNTNSQLTIIDHAQPPPTETRARPIIAASYGDTVALKTDGSLWEWGGAILGFTYPQAFSPSIGTDRDWVTVAAGRQHILALKADRSLWAWGNNDLGQCGLGDGIFTVDTPTRIGTENDWIAIAASGDNDTFSGTHSLALKADGSLWSWGSDYGELGRVVANGSSYTPSRVGSDSDWVSIAAGCGTSLARKRDGSLWAWGRRNWNHSCESKRTTRLARLRRRGRPEPRVSLLHHRHRRRRYPLAMEFRPTCASNRHCLRLGFTAVTDPVVALWRTP